MSDRVLKLAEEDSKAFYGTKEWGHVRQDVLERDNFECQMCKAEGKVHVDSRKVDGKKKPIELNVHHIQELEEHPDLALDMDNLITLCVEHHNEVHERFGGTVNKWADDERW